MAKGTATGTASSVDGDFMLECAQGDTLIVSYIGYQDKTIIVKNANIYTITMKESAKDLEEVVVTAFGSRTEERVACRICSANQTAGT